MLKKNILEVYNGELERIDNELHYEEDVNVDNLNMVGVESFCATSEVYNHVDYNIGYVEGMQFILSLMEEDDDSI